jgi:hypothetical protein
MADIGGSSNGSAVAISSSGGYAFASVQGAAGFTSWAWAMTRGRAESGANGAAAAASGGFAAASYGTATASFFGEALVSGDGQAHAVAAFGGFAGADANGVRCHGFAYAVADNGLSCFTRSPFELLVKRLGILP